MNQLDLDQVKLNPLCQELREEAAQVVRQAVSMHFDFSCFHFPGGRQLPQKELQLNLKTLPSFFCVYLWGIFSPEACASHQTGRSMREYTSNVAGASSEAAISARICTSPSCWTVAVYSSSSVAKEPRPPNSTASANFMTMMPSTCSCTSVSSGAQPSKPRL